MGEGRVWGISRDCSTTAVSLRGKVGSILVPRGVFESYIFCWQHQLFTIKLQISVSSVKRQIQNRKISLNGWLHGPYCSARSERGIKMFRFPNDASGNCGSKILGNH
jgi:hypothetical protein